MAAVGCVYDVYLAGPLTSFGDHAENLIAFQKAAKLLRDKGLTVFSPPENEPLGLSWREYLEADIPHLLAARTVVMLPCWAKSAGASLEVHIARALGTPTIPLEEYIQNMSEHSTKPNLYDAVISAMAPEINETRKLDAVDVYPSPEPPKKAERVKLEDQGDPEFDKLSLLRQAELLVTRDRGDAYGDPVDDFERTAAMWSVLLDCTVNPAQVATCMVALKLSRLTWEDFNPESWRDIAGYAACGKRVTSGGW